MSEAPGPRAVRPLSGWSWLGLAGLVGLALVLAWRYWGQATDDGFITYCYARSWAETGALSFNDTVTYGITAPGYALLLGGLGRLSSGSAMDIPGWGTLLSLLSLALIWTVLWRRCRRSAVPAVRLLPALAGPVLLIMPLMIGLWGSENMVAIALLVGAGSCLLIAERPGAGGLLACAAIVVRMDAALGALILGLVAWARWRKVPWRYGLTGVLPLIPWCLFLFWTFGDVFPSTLEAKRLQLKPGMGSYTSQQWDYLRWAVSGPGAVALLSLAAVGLAGLRRLPRTGEGALVLALLAWPLGQELLYRNLGLPAAAWYHLTSLIALLVLACWGASVTAGALARRLGSSPSSGRGRTHTALSLALTMTLLSPLLVSSVQHLQDTWSVPLDMRHRVYREIGEYLHEHAEPDALIASSEIGILGWYARRPLLDMCGIVDPDVVAARQQGQLYAHVRDRDPDYILDNPAFHSEPEYARIIVRPVLKMEYDLLETYRTPEFSPDGILLWKRRER